MKTSETIQESHFDFRNYSNFKDKDITKKQVENFFKYMPKELLALIEKEFALNKAEWEKDHLAYFKKSMRHRSDSFMIEHGLNDDGWYRTYVPWRIRNIGYSIERYYRKVIRDKQEFYKWYYPIEDMYDSLKQTVKDIYTKITVGYVWRDIWNFDWEIAKVMVPRLIEVKNMERHTYIRNEEASQENYKNNPDGGCEENEVNYTDEEWDEIMNKIIFGFMIKEADEFDFNDSQFSLPSDSYWKLVNAIHETQKEGRILFAKHFYQFGD